MARPRIEIDWKLVENLCNIHCTAEEICGVMGIAYETLVRNVKRTYKKRLDEYLEEKRAGGRVSLRRKQWNKALTGEGNTTMLIWLGKQHLGQSDRLDTRDLTADAPKRIEHIYTVQFADGERPINQDEFRSKIAAYLDKK